VDDRVGLGSADCLANGPCIEYVEHDRLGAKCPKSFRVVLRPRGADDLVASMYQLRNEPHADRTGRAYD
jgi:hypothetical protein